MSNYFEILRAGINTTFQDNGRKNLYHIGVPFSGAMDQRNFRLANSIAGNKSHFPVIEFAYQGPLIKYNGNEVNFVITGDVIFKIIKGDKEIQGNCYENYSIKDGDEIIMPSYTYVSTANAFVLRGGKPVFVDIDQNTCNINRSKIEWFWAASRILFLRHDLVYASLS